ncbi:MAG TPA: right-handed parallel beta-helix repeat-containing protein [Candidatus Limnocylindrales bacterium]|nr:right-handed parallel beta-helix repeat-containing protein [Candidatus Limnocylindrales bacterium]
MKQRFKLSRKAILVILSVIVLTLPAVVVFLQKSQNYKSKAAEIAVTWPTTPPAQICGTNVTTNPSSIPPAGAVSVPAGDNGQFFQNEKFSGATGKTYWFEPGIHTLGTSEYGQIEPRPNSTYLGAPSAVLDGQKLNRSAFSQQAENVRIAYLEIRNFVSVRDQGVVNHDSGRGWTIENNWVHHNAGAGVFLGTDNIMRNNCLADNGQYGFQALGNNTDPFPTNITVDHNEVTRNNADDHENKVNPDGSVGCGCTGGAKFWLSNDVRVTNNWIHDNQSVGLWFDNNNRGSLIERNLIEGNFSEGVFIEAGYDAIIRHNTIRRNAIGKGQSFVNRGDTTFPVSAIYVSESGSPEGYNIKYLPTVISNNLIEDNWNGVALWESPDRYSGSGAHTHISGTIKIGDLINDTKCKSGIPNDIPDNIDPYLCRWSTENVIVENNDFRINKAAVGTGCLGGDVCGVNSIFSASGSFPEFSGYTIPWRITFQQGNIFRNNTYTGDWKFAGFERSKPGGARWTWAEWTAPAPAVPTTFTHDNRPQTFGQDAGSTYNGAGNGGTIAPSTPTPTSTTATPTTVPNTPTPTAPPVSTPTPILPTPTLVLTDSTSPTITIVSPSNGATVTRGRVLTITANASDNVGITRVEFYINGSLKCTDTTSFYTCSWNVPSKRGATYTIKAVAYDAANNKAESVVTVRSN